MADLARLRSMFLRDEHNMFTLAAMSNIMISDPTQHSPLHYANVESFKDWIIASPGVFFGSGCDIDEDELVVLKDSFRSMEPRSLDKAVILAQAMRLSDKHFTRVTRGISKAQIVNSEAGAQSLTQSPVEFALLDVLTECGFASEADARNEMHTFLARSQGSRLTISPRQFSRGRVFGTLSLKIIYPSERRVVCVSPLFTSRETVYAYFAVLFRSIIRDSARRNVTKRARTVLGYAARASLTSVRRIVDGARAILSSYTYDDELLAFINARGRVEYDINNRTPAVVVAFAKVLTGGSCDVNYETSRSRSGIECPGGYGEWDDHFLDADLDVAGLLMCTAGCLASARAFRSSHPGGFELNKDPCLSYVAREKSAEARNTAACINRVEEVACLMRMRKVDLASCVLYIEWAGRLDHDRILAAAAMTGSLVVLDVGRGAFRVGDPSDEVVDPDDQGALVCLVPHAKERGLNRMPVLPYEAHDSLTRRFEIVNDTLGSRGNYPPMIYISGGDVTRDISPADLTMANCSLLSLAREVSNVTFFTADVLVPPMCEHQRMAGVNVCMEPVASDGCGACSALEGALASLADALVAQGVSIVKTRSSYAHNMHFALEYQAGQLLPDTDRTSVTLEGVVNSNRCRNAPWDSYLPQSQVRRAGHQEFYDVASIIVADAYRRMASSSNLEIGTVVDSLV